MSNCDNFPNPLWAQNLGNQGLPGTLPADLNAEMIDYAPCGTVMPKSNDTVAAALCYLEKELLARFLPANFTGAAAGEVLVMDADGKTVNPTPLLELLNKYVKPSATGPDAGKESVLVYDTATQEWTPTPLGDAIADALAADGTLATAMADIFGCTKGEVLTCVDGKFQAAPILAVLNADAPGTSSNEALVWNQAGKTYEPKSIGAIVTAELPDALPEILKEAFGCTEGNALACSGGVFGSEPVSKVLGSDEPGATAGDILAWDPVGKKYVASDALAALALSNPGTKNRDRIEWNGTEWKIKSFPLFSAWPTAGAVDASTLSGGQILFTGIAAGDSGATLSAGEIVLPLDGVVAVTVRAYIYSGGTNTGYGIRYIVTVGGTLSYLDIQDEDVSTAENTAREHTVLAAVTAGQTIGVKVVQTTGAVAAPGQAVVFLDAGTSPVTVAYI